ncbi:hypothetical protein [Phytoactinopolyspora mesophila]|uniref:Type IV toxin-antitoxin system AbiEi family antitoxin domain-containing protein n=1 Tax=Phytoactinopolyspora mesophila TaxID=2650750 RepID=A0A7K3M799_9ACTN|nr:hypothetical protein [Phytoactinopolyspora mesophila]NDL59144.1 hypothetical protein [Phytoactinopolyspora mesophila]
MSGRRLTQLPSNIRTLLRQCEGLIDVGLARNVGVRPQRLAELERAGLLVRMADGVYASAAAVARSEGWQLHELSARAFAISSNVDALLTGWSAVTVWQLPTLGRPPERPVVVRPKRRGRGPKQSAYGRILTHRVPPEHHSQTRRVRLVSQEWAAATIALTTDIPAALVVADAVVRQGLDIGDATRFMSRWPGVTRARWVAQNADPLSESPIETLGRFGVIAGGLPMPVSNAWVGADEPEFRLDGLWPYHFAAHEADGAGKYNNRPDAAAIVAKEKEREWRLRRLGLDIVRYDFGMAAFRRDEMIRRFGRLLRDNPPRSVPIRWWKHVPGVGPVDPGPADWPSPHPTSIILPPDWWRDGR